MSVLLTGGNVNDTTMFAPLLAALRIPRSGAGRPRTCPDYVVADKGYSSRARSRSSSSRSSSLTASAITWTWLTRADRVPLRVQRQNRL